MMQHKKIEMIAHTVLVDSIQQLDDDQFTICSLMDPSQVYEVDLKAYTCNCKSFPNILFCHHLGVVQIHFG